MVPRLTYFITIGLLAASIVSCDTLTEAEQPGATPQMDLTIHFPDQSVHSLEILKAEMRINELKFEGETTHDDDFEIEVKDENGLIIDLLSDTFQSELTASIPKGPFEEVELRLESDSGGEIPSLVVEGILRDSMEQAIPFRIEFNQEIKFRLEIEQERDPFLFEDGFLGLFQFPARFKKSIEQTDPLLWESLTLNEDGLLLINRDHNVELFAALGLNLDIDIKIEFEH